MKILILSAFIIILFGGCKSTSNDNDYENNTIESGQPILPLQSY